MNGKREINNSGEKQQMVVAVPDNNLITGALFQ
jgi:hypothetical protein